MGEEIAESLWLHVCCASPALHALEQPAGSSWHLQGVPFWGATKVLVLLCQIFGKFCVSGSFPQPKAGSAAALVWFSSPFPSLEVPQQCQVDLLEWEFQR